MIDVLWFLLPAAAANAAPVIAARVFPRFRTPLDLGAKIGRKRVFGDHKTWRGIIAGTATGVFVAWLQSLANVSFATIDYSIYWLPVGLLLGFGAVMGDAIKSAFKRRVGILPGSPWVPFDQVDYVMGALALASFIYWPGWPLAVAATTVYGFGHVLSVWLGKVMGIRKSWF